MEPPWTRPPSRPRPRKVLVRLDAVEQLYDRKIRILGPLDLDVREGEFLSLVGPSGCGKSTLLRIVAGVLRPDAAAAVFLGDRPLEGVNPSAALVFQSFALFPWLTVVDNVALGLEARGLGVHERLKKAEKYIHLVGLSGYERAYPEGALARDEAARRPGARAGRGARAALHGRAVLGAGRPDRPRTMRTSSWTSGLRRRS